MEVHNEIINGAIHDQNTSGEFFHDSLENCLINANLRITYTDLHNHDELRMCNNPLSKKIISH